MLLCNGGPLDRRDDEPRAHAATSWGPLYGAFLVKKFNRGYSTLDAVG
jgi:hypothetical protein